MKNTPCCDLITLGVPRRPANALNLEIGQPLDRCRLRTPAAWADVDPRGARWLLSGGSPLVLGLCTPNSCPKSRVQRTPAGGSGAGAVARAVDAGLVVHVEHPNFGGTLTAGRSQRADGTHVYELIAHGSVFSVGVVADLDGEFPTAIELGRALEFQVGSRRAYWAAMRRLEAA